MPLSSSSSSSSGSSTPSSSRSTTPRPRLAQLPSVRNSYAAQLGSPRSPTSPTAAAAALQGPGTPSLLGRASSYTLHSLAEPEVDAHNVSAESDGTRLLARASASGSNPRTYGATGTAEPAAAGAATAAGVVPWHQRPLVKAALKVALLFAVSAAVLGGTLWLALPRIKPQDRPLLHIPRNFEDLQGLNTLLKRYRKRSPIRIVICWAATYLLCVGHARHSALRPRLLIRRSLQHPGVLRARLDVSVHPGRGPVGGAADRGIGVPVCRDGQHAVLRALGRLRPRASHRAQVAHAHRGVRRQGRRPARQSPLLPRHPAHLAHPALDGEPHLAARPDRHRAVLGVHASGERASGRHPCDHRGGTGTDDIGRRLPPAVVEEPGAAVGRCRCGARACGAEATERWRGARRGGRETDRPRCCGRGDGERGIGIANRAVYGLY